LKKKNENIILTQEEDKLYSSNIIENVNYTSTDSRGNEYIINASQGEIDFSNNNVIYLTNVNAVIKLTNSNDIKIKSDYGKYNTVNFDTIFSKNVIIKYLENKINGEYLDFSIERNSMIISRNVVYTNIDNILNADVIEIDIQTKDTKIFMYDSKKKVNIKNKD
jgi:lipopolysaccharide export system protein LptA